MPIFLRYLYRCHEKLITGHIWIFFNNLVYITLGIKAWPFFNVGVYETDKTADSYTSYIQLFGWTNVAMKKACE